MKIHSLLLITSLVLSSVAAPAAESTPPKSKIENPKSKISAPKPYPLDVCIVTDNDLGSMGEETFLIYEGQTVKFCCAPCEKKFLKNPARYLAKLTEGDAVKK